MAVNSFGVTVKSVVGWPHDQPRPERGQDKPAAFATIAPYRYNDVLWENDRTAHRIYSTDLEVPQPPSSSGIDEAASSQ